MDNQQKQAVIDAIKQLDHRVTAADVASKTGLPLNVANSALNSVAAETAGHMEVSTTGDIVYKFAPGFENAYMAKGIEKAFQTVFSKMFEIGYFLLRISFGIMLIVSFIAILLLIIAVVFALSRMGSDDSDGGDAGGWFNFDFFDYMLLRDMLWWGAWSTPNVYVDYDRPYSRQPQKQKGNFLFNVFSFLFGDGNPNSHLDERKWQMIAETIQNSSGVVTAEQLAPFTGADPKNEDSVLPVLVRFDGKPEVTDSGNIVYTFPSMQVHGTLSHFRSGTTHLREYPWPFTNVDQGSLTTVYLLAIFNFFGSWWLYMEQSKLVMLHALQPLIFALTAYGTMFVVVPLIRYCVLQVINQGIEERNKQREHYAVIVQNKPKELAAKLQEAQQYRIGERLVSEKNVVYSTEKDALDQKDDLDEQFEKMENASPAKPEVALHPARAPQPTHQNEFPHVLDQQSFAEDGQVIDLSQKEMEQEHLERTKNKRNQSLSD